MISVLTEKSIFTSNVYLRRQKDGNNPAFQRVRFIDFFVEMHWKLNAKK